MACGRGNRYHPLAGSNTRKVAVAVTEGCSPGAHLDPSPESKCEIISYLQLFLQYFGLSFV